MECLLFHLCLLCITQALPTNRSTAEGDVFGVENPDMFEINEALHLNLFEGDIRYSEPTNRSTAEGDVYGVENPDLFEINEALHLNLFEGDIRYSEDGKQRSTIQDKTKHWTSVIPYHLNSSLDLNAKGVILQAFDMFRLKSCIDFVPWTGEQDYISVVKANGCWSYIGKQRGHQKLSIGAQCDDLAIVEHELLHALGIWHEQSRTDRDDYVTIQWLNIEEEKSSNFEKNTLQESDSLNVPYDYLSVMHYNSKAFQKAPGLNTIITKDMHFMDIIGQRLDISELDRVQLNRMYRCTSSLALLDRCTFDNPTICGMEQITTDDADWHWVSGSHKGLFTREIDDGGPYLLFNSTAASPGDVAVIETHVLQPQRAQQCLQIYYQHKGSRDDQLQIAISHPSNSPQFKVVSSIPAANINRWTLAQVPLSESSPFRLALRAVAGVSAEMGGWAVDDLTLMELACFPHIWHIPNFTSILDKTPAGSAINSPRFISADGYSFQLNMYPNGMSQNSKSISLFVHLISGDKDEKLQWPCPWKQITMSVMDQNSDVRLRMSSTHSFTTDPNLQMNIHGSIVFVWDRPDRIGVQVGDHGSTYFRGPGYGYKTFLSHVYLHRRQYIRHRDMVILINFEDISHLRKPQLVNKPSNFATSMTSQKGNIQDTILYAWITIWSIVLISGWI